MNAQDWPSKILEEIPDGYFLTMYQINGVITFLLGSLNVNIGKTIKTDFSLQEFPSDRTWRELNEVRRMVKCLTE